MSFKTSWGLGAFAAAVLLASPAFAQDDYIPDDDGDESVVYDMEPNNTGAFRELSVAVTGGLNTFTSDIGDTTNTGAYLGLQANSRPLPLLGVELGYEGSRNPFENLEGGLWRHNVGALAKVGPELLSNGQLRPFVGAGFGVSSLNPSEDGEILFENDFITEVPLAAGVDYNFGAVTAGARATYRLVGGEDLGLNQDGDILNYGIQVGGAF